MQLTTHTDYALRLLMYLAMHDTKEAATVQDAARRYGISNNHLAKVAQNLVQHGYISGQRGRGGGLKLVHTPEETNIGELVRNIESFNLVECFGEGSMCKIQQACRLSEAINEAREAFIETLEKYSLADLIQPKVRLNRLLQLRKTTKR